MTTCAYNGTIGSCGYPQAKVDQTPKYDNAVRKGRKRRKKRKQP
jgi:hypothetical protein